MVKYIALNQNNLAALAEKYVDYYNNCEGGVWTTEKALTRIGQVMNICDSYCIVQTDGGNVTGFAMGYFKQYDDLVSYFLEEIVVFKSYQNQGYGTKMLKKLQKHAKARGAKIMELMSVNDLRHMHFYGKFGFKQTKTLAPMGKFFN